MEVFAEVLRIHKADAQVSSSAAKALSTLCGHGLYIASCRLRRFFTQPIACILQTTLSVIYARCLTAENNVKTARLHIVDTVIELLNLHKENVFVLRAVVEALYVISANGVFLLFHRFQL